MLKAHFLLEKLKTIFVLLEIIVMKKIIYPDIRFISRKIPQENI